MSYTWYTAGSSELKELEDKEEIKAYLSWIDYNSEITFEDAFAKFSKEQWKPSWHRWVNIFINSQSQSGLKLMRELYTQKSNKNWKTATMKDVENTLGYCNFPELRNKIILGGGSSF